MMHHLMLIDEQIRGGRYPNATTLAQDLELATRTIGRKIEFMRGMSGAPIEYDASRHGYHYTERSWSLPSLQITAGELLGLALAKLALQAYNGTPLEGYLERIVGKLAAVLPEAVDVAPSGTFGVWERKKQHNVRIRFTGPAARYIEERRWHPSQKLTRRRDGSVELSMTLSDIGEVGRWVLTWGDSARALAPWELVGFVRDTARSVADQYRGNRRE